jgi:hypothetical protein
MLSDPAAVIDRCSGHRCGHRRRSDALADTLGLPEELVVAALNHGPLAGIAGRAFAAGSLFQFELAAKDIALATAVADLPIGRAVLDRLRNFPAASTEDIGQIVRHIRAQTAQTG